MKFFCKISRYISTQNDLQQKVK